MVVCVFVVDDNVDDCDDVDAKKEEVYRWETFIESFVVVGPLRVTPGQRSVASATSALKDGYKM